MNDRISTDMEGDVRPVVTEEVSPGGVVYLNKQWQKSALVPGRAQEGRVALLTTEETKELAQRLSEEFFQNSHIIENGDITSYLKENQENWEAYDGFIDLTGCSMERDESLEWIKAVQKLIEKGRKRGITILGVTKGLESFQNASVNLSGASRAGLYRMLQSEYSHVRSRHLDLDTVSDHNDLAKQIANEFLVECEESEVCYRKGERYGSFLEEDEGNREKTGTIQFPEEQVLLITGGTRGLGLLCAEHFVKKYGVKRLVLTGRELFPTQEQWESYGERGDTISGKIKAIQALMAMDVEVRVLSTSLTDEQAVKKDMQEIIDNFGSIGGVIHCAGRLDFQNPAFIRKSVQGIQQVLDPEVQGLHILLSQLHKEPLKFFILFSSVSAIIPTLSSGQSDYAMANACMDYLADAHVHNCPLVSIQWPGWKETRAGEVTGLAYRRTGLMSLANQEGFEILDHILSTGMGPVILPALVDPKHWDSQALMKRQLPDKESLPEKSQGVKQIHLSEVSKSLVKAIEKWLTELFSRELKIDKERLERDTPFQDYGADSVLLAQVFRVISEKFTEPLDPSLLFEYSTIESLAAWLTRTHGDLLSTEFGEERDGISEPSFVTTTTPALTPLWADSGNGSSLVRDIAVVGMSCRFPGAPDLNEYWKLLSEGGTAISAVPENRLGGATTFYAALINSITEFDPSFFLIPMEDARAMDPQALLVLEESLNLFYHAGYSLEEIKGSSTGVYLGGRSQHKPEEQMLKEARNPIMALGQNYLATNISQFFDLKGPGLVVDTACSSAIVAMSAGIKDLLTGEIDAALVGGVSLLTNDGPHRLFQIRNLLSRDASFHIFDKRASGVILGEGVGLVLLKRLDQAQKEGDHIYAIIKGLAINNDGRTAGPATPNIKAQKEVMERALKKSGKKSEEIVYIEANGSGSEVSDLLELKAIESIYRSSDKVPCRLGSMKPNIGHPLCAEGIAGFIKLVLMIDNREWVPFLSGKEAMTHYDLEKSPFFFDRERTPWPETSHAVALNCFADGGTNGHVILEGWQGQSPKRLLREPLSPPKINRVNVYGGNKSNGDGSIRVNPWKQKRVAV